MKLFHLSVNLLDNLSLQKQNRRVCLKLFQTDNR